MNNKIFNSILAAGLTLALASCGENTWNDKYLDGFEGGANYDTPSSTEGTYTLTDEDYTALSRALEKVATTDEEKAAAKAIGANKYIDKNSTFPASVALPYFMSTASFPYYLDANGSNVAMTYNEAGSVPAELTAIAGAATYTVTEADYQNVWGSDQDYTASFAPSHTAERSLPGILKAAMPDATEGQYAVVSYNTAAVDPVFGSVDEPEFEMSNVLGSLTKGDAIEIKGVIMATSTQGPIIADAAGSAFVYRPTNNNDLKTGDQVTISSTVDTYNYGFQIAKNAEAVVSGNTEVTYPAAKSWTGSEIDKFVADAMAEGASPISPIYSTFTGKAIVDKYINIELEGTTVQVSPYGVNDETKAMITNGSTVTIEGYVIAIASKGKFLNTVVTKVNGTAVKAVAKVPASRAVMVASTAENAVYRYDGSKWAAADGVIAMNPADYAAIGVDNNKLTDIATYGPLFLKKELPYALSGDSEYVVYNGTKCDLFVFDGSSWTINNNGLETVTARFTRKNGAWTFVKYLGKAVFNLFSQEKVIADRTYLLVAGDQAAVPIPTTKNYGYPEGAAVAINNNTIVLANDAYGFSFASSYTDEDGKTIKTPEGQYLLVDSNSRYYYLSGSYNSPNVTNAPKINDGAIDETYLFTVTPDADGTWLVERGDRLFMYSPNYSSYGFYQESGRTPEMVKPHLYILD